MSQASPEPPSNPRRLTGDELIALFVAFTTLGSVLFWGLTRTGVNLFATPLLAEGTERIIEPDSRRFDLFGEEEPEAEPPFVPSLPAPQNSESDLERRVRRRQDAIREDPPIRFLERQQSIREQFEREPAQAAAPTTLMPEREPVSFEDVPEDYWAKPYIDALSSAGLIAGLADNTFQPEKSVTRAELAKLLTQAFELKENSSSLTFTDISEEDWAASAINEAATGGFMKGFPDDSFRPDLPVPRTQTLTALVTGLGLEPGNDPTSTVQQYADASTIPDWAVDKIAAATNADLVVNYPDVEQLNPDQPTTRAEAAVMVYQALVYQGKQQPLESEYIVNP